MGDTENPNEPVRGQCYKLALGDTFEEKPPVSFYNFAFDFKPASIDLSTAGSIEIAESGSSAVTVGFQTKTHEEPVIYQGAKSDTGGKDCIIVFDEETGEFTMQLVHTHVRLKQSRGVSNLSLPDVSSMTNLDDLARLKKEGANEHPLRRHDSEMFDNDSHVSDLSDGIEDYNVPRTESNGHDDKKTTNGDEGGKLINHAKNINDDADAESKKRRRRSSDHVLHENDGDWSDSSSSSSSGFSSGSDAKTLKKNYIDDTSMVDVGESPKRSASIESDLFGDEESTSADVNDLAGDIDVVIKENVSNGVASGGVSEDDGGRRASDDGLDLSESDDDSD